MGAYLGGEHQFMSESLQVDTQDLQHRNTHTDSDFEFYSIKTEIFLHLMKPLYEYLWQVLHLTKFDPIS